MMTSFFNSVEVTLLLGSILVALYWYLTYTFDYWKKRNVVHDKPYPFVGTYYKQLLSIEHAMVALQQVYHKYPKEDVVGGFQSRSPVLILRNPDVIKQVLVRNFNNFQDHGIIFHVDEKREPLTQHLFNTTGHTWKVMRQKLSPTFTSGKLKSGIPLLTECGKEFQKYLKELEVDQEVDIKDVMAKFTTDVIGTYAFGMKMNSMKDDNAPFRVMGRKIFEFSLLQTLKSGLNVISPLLFNLLGYRLTLLEVETFFIDLFKSVVASRNNKPSARHDFVDLLIQLKIKGYVESDTSHQDDTNIDKSTTITFTDELLTAQAFFFFIAGFETSSTTMQFALYELAKYPSVQRKAQKEIDNIIAKYNGEITYESLKEMNYLQMVIDETLRMYPPVGVLDRACTIPYNLSPDIHLDKGVLINVPLFAIQRDPKYYPEPEKFVPERFTPEEIAKRHPCTYMPFGEGPRICIGLRFAKIQTMIGLISVLQNYSVEGNTKTVKEIKVEVKSFILASKDTIYLSLKPRKPENTIN